MFNARSIVKKVLDVYFEVILQLDWPDMISITETWLRNDIPDTVFSACKGYSVFRRDRCGKKGGGVAILTKPGVSCHSIDVPSDTYVEAVGVCYSGPSESFIMCTVYRPPCCDSSCVSSFLRLLRSLESYDKGPFYLSMYNPPPPTKFSAIFPGSPAARTASTMYMQRRLVSGFLKLLVQKLFEIG